MRSITEITSLILAGGLGTRLRSIVNDRQKVTAFVKDRPFVYYLLDQLIHIGIRKVVLCVGYLGDQVKSTLGNDYKGLEIAYSYENEPMGTGGAIRLALPFLTSDPALILNGDSFCEVKLNDFWKFHQEKNAKISMVLVNMPDTTNYGRVSLDQAGRILSFSEKGQSGSGWINAGIYLISHDILEKMPLSRISIEKDLFPAWIGNEFFGYPCESKFLDIGTPSTYAAAERFFD
jgi:D-glycero-alpha-D-manno-heptose 1-phosphate guanylyltransferase